jgi:pilus assembly protein CpaB
VTRRRRGILLAGLALLLGGLAASDVARRERAVAARLSPTVPVVVTRAGMDSGHRIAGADLAVRRIPMRFAPAGVAADPAEVVGMRLAADVPAGAFISHAHVAVPDGGPAVPVRRGERAVEVVASGSPELVVAGARVDVLITRDQGGRGGTELALEGVEVLAASAARAAPDSVAGPRVTATLRVTVRQAVFLTAAQSFAREIRLLPRADGDRSRTGAVAVGEGLR